MYKPKAGQAVSWDNEGIACTGVVLEVDNVPEEFGDKILVAKHHHTEWPVVIIDRVLLESIK